MRILLNTARVYVFLYDVTGEQHYLEKAWDCCYKARLMTEETKEIKWVA